MLTYTINSTKLNRPVTFSCPKKGGYIYVDLEKEGQQICTGGSLTGGTISIARTCDNFEGLFRATCRAWWRNYLRKLNLWNNGVYYDDTL